MSDLDAMTAALRASSDDAPVDATHTRLKIRESLAPARKKRFAWLVGGGLVFAAGASWALATGQVQRLFASAPPVAPPVIPAPAIAHAPAPAVAPAPAPVPVPVPAPVAVQAAGVIGNEEAEAESGTAPVHVPGPRPVAVPHPASASSFRITGSEAKPVELEPLFKIAHDLHFHGGSPTESLAAWDAYLATDPNGRFAVEARYNRAVDLIKLDRLAEAQQALAPFAAGEVQPAGYRQAEAAELVKRIDKRIDDRLNGSK